MEDGFIKLYRSILDWEWYKDTNTKILFLHLLLNANWEDSRYRGHDIPKGSVVIGYTALSKQLGISKQSVRTALSHLKSTGEITLKSTNKFSIVTIVNWEKFQGGSSAANTQSNTQANTQLTYNQHSTNTIKEIKKLRNKEIKNKESAFAPPTLEEVRDYCLERQNGISPDSFINFYESKGWMIGKNKMKDWKAAVRTWEKRHESKPVQGNHGHYNFEELEREIRERKNG